MAYYAVNSRPAGGLDKDTNLLEVKGGNYLDMLNARHSSEAQNGVQDPEIVLGNDFVFDAGSIAAQNKKYRVYVYAITGSVLVSSSTLDFYNQNDAQLCITAPYVNTASIATTLLNCTTAITNAIGATFPLQTVTLATTTINPASGYVDIELTTVNYVDWSLKIVTSTADSYIAVLQEAIDASLVGENKLIGSYDLLGDLFMWWTSQTELPSNFLVTTVNNSTPRSVTTISAHGLSTGERVFIIGIVGATTVNGEWIVTVTSTTTFSLNGSVSGSSYTSGGTVTINPSGIGTVSVAQKNQNTGAWYYTKLLTTTALNLVTKKQVDARAELGSLYKSLYFTDYYNTPRTLKYNGDYATNGFVTAFNSDGLYAYDTINLESRLILGSPNVYMIVTQQELGGKLNAGNKRYAVRFENNSNVFTDWSYLSNPIPVYDTIITTNVRSQNKIRGNNGGAATTKANLVTISGINYGIYKSIQLGYIEYTDLSISGYIVTTKSLSPKDVGDFEILHTGYETDSQSLDIGSLNSFSAQILTAQNIEILQNRLVLSKLTQQVDLDLSTFATAITYSIQRKSLNGIGTTSPNIYIRQGEYNDPDNVFNYMGYMHNETYRFGIEVKWKNADWSAAYFIDDIIIDCSGASGQRTGGLVNFDLSTTPTSSVNYTTYVPYVQFSNINRDFRLDDGRTLRDAIDGFRIVRAECVKEVLATGTTVLSKLGGFYWNSREWSTAAIYTPSANENMIGYFRSPDVYLGQDQITFISGDKLYTQGNGVFAGQYSQSNSVVVEYDGNFSAILAYGSHTLLDTHINNDLPIVIGGLNIVDGVFNGNAVLTEPSIICVTIVTEPLIVPSGGNANNYGLFYCQYFRALADKYGDESSTKYVTTGHIVTDVSDVTLTTTYDVYGGDTFTQKSFLSIYVTSQNEPPAGSKRCISFVSQNRVNSQMLYQDTALPYLSFPNIAGSVGQWLTTPNLDNHLYDTGYNIINGVRNEIAFDSRVAQISDLPTRIAYSNLKPNGTISDQYQDFLPLNFLDITMSNGAIEAMLAVNGELFTWQNRKFSRLFFNAHDVLETGTGSEVLIGDGAVLSRPPIDLSIYGSSHKFAVIKGRSKGGKDTVYWINVEFAKFMRFGADGTVALSDMKNMSIFFKNNLWLASYCNTPADNLGIHGAFWSSMNEVVFTVRAERVTVDSNGTTFVGYETWSARTIPYQIGDVVIVSGNTYSDTYEEFKVFYVSLTEHLPTVVNKPQTGATWKTNWRRISYGDDDYNQFVQAYTIVFNEDKNFFTLQYTHKPKIYMEYKDSLLSPSPIDESRVSEHNLGEYARWYCTTASPTGSLTFTASSTAVTGSGGNFLTDLDNPSETNRYYVTIDGIDYEVASVESFNTLTLRDNYETSEVVSDFSWKHCNSQDAHIETVVNQPFQVIKYFKATRWDTEIEPESVEFTTESHISSLSSSVDEDFELNELQYDGAVKNDETVSAENPTGLNTLDTSELWGRWMKVKLYMKNGKYQRIHNFITKIVQSTRNYQS